MQLLEPQPIWLGPVQYGLDDVRGQQCELQHARQGGVVAPHMERQFLDAGIAT